MVTAMPKTIQHFLLTSVIVSDFNIDQIPERVIQAYQIQRPIPSRNTWFQEQKPHPALANRQWRHYC